MSPLPKAFRGRLYGFALSAFVAWALCLPLLAALGMPGESWTALLYAAVISALFTLHGLLPGKTRFLLPLAAVAILLALGFLQKGSLPARLILLAKSLLSGAPPAQALTLYIDALLPLLTLLLCLFARLLMEGDPAFTLPLMVAPTLMMWFLGVRESVSVYFPSVLALPLLYLYTGRNAAEQPLAGKPRGLLARALVIALALALLASALTPQQRQTLPAAEKMAEEIRRRIEDLFFFTSSRSMFTLGSQGYQPMGEKGLGGQPDISLTPVMNVQTAERLYLRGTALDTYTGRSWYDSLSLQRHAWQSGRFAGLRRELYNEELPQGERLEEKTAEVTLLSDMPSTLFVPQRLRGLSPGPDMVAYYNASTEVFITRDLVNGDTYTLRHEPYVAGETRTDALAMKLAPLHGSIPEQLLSDYLKLPPHLLPDGIIAELAREITGLESQPYRKALALMRYLKSNYTYSVDVPDAPENQDFAAHFLFDQQSGYCTYFATAMTVLARSAGLPARYVEGFLADPQGLGSVTLTGKNAHAWTEIYFGGLGWVVFDATAARDGEGEQDDGNQPPQGQQPSPSPSPSPEPSPSPSPEPQGVATPTPPPPDEAGGEPSPQPTQEPESGQPPRPDSPFPWWLVLLLIALGLMAWLILRENPARKEKRLGGNDRVLAMYWQALLDTRRAAKQGIRANETPLSYAMRIAPENQEMQELAAIYSAYVYGRRQPERLDAGLAGSLYRDAWRQTAWYRKPGLMLGRAVRPLAKSVQGAFRRLKAALRPRRKR